MRDIKRIIIHCSATPPDMDIGVKEIREWHMKGNGWRDIGYHYVIRLNGEIESGRSIDEVGAHTKGHNADSIGICYIGGVGKNNKPKDTMYKCQEDSMRELIFSLRVVADEELTIHGHNEFSDKACPSFKVSKKFKDIL